ncbi:TIGR02710 family CRISPR-associated CARF protein [Chloroflexus sp.]|uniref:TIGR02710 family CRISPR-associated CARF protein n=1 Tax=Chloroflexus sp. TaxID=1904827 RepID=UPI002ADD9CDC|nr:TIGR02710 family CRISPR-associated CARF protein [Chloroflexus sp.]
MDFNEQLARFIAQVGPRQTPALIIPGSRQADTAALLIAALKPERVAFLLTPETTDFPAQVAAKIGQQPANGWLCKTAPYTDINQVYRELRAVIEAWSDLERDQILVDLTGGTKPMTVGLAKAAYVLGLRTVYIESDYEQNRVIPGSQRLIEPSDPYEVFGDLEAKEAVRFFNAHDYVSAERIYTDLAKRVQAEDGTFYKAMAQLARAYTQWESFDIATAVKTMADLLAHPLPARLVPYQSTLHDHYQALISLDATIKAMSNQQQALTTLANRQAILPLLGSLYANALRRETQRRYDTAALLRYRCLELMSQHRLATRGVWVEKPDLDQLKAQIPDLDRSYRAVERSLGFRERGLQPNRDGQYNPITLLNGYMLLTALSDPLIQTITLTDIRQRVNVRNKSILAHGFRQITEAEYRDFAKVVEQLLDQFFAIAQEQRSSWEERYQFIKLPSSDHRALPRKAEL